MNDEKEAPVKCKLPKITRRQFVGGFGAGAGCGLFSQAISARQGRAAPGEKPNIVLIIADDLGYGEVSCYPQTNPVRTPNIDRIARGGIRMTQGYSADPMCLPSRASLLTGNYHQRYRSPRQLTDRLIAEYLKDAGYITGCFGKWHNCVPGTRKVNDPISLPTERGFDEFYGFLGGMHDYFDHKTGRWNPHGDVYMPVYDQTRPVKSAKYLTEEFTDRAVDFIRRHRDRPFFCYLPYNAPHTPNQAPEMYIRRNNGDVRLAMIDALDMGVGRVLDALDKAGVAENSLVIFYGDNGGAPSPNWNLRGRKAYLYEGGIRVPCLVSWPKALPVGGTYEGPVMHFDVLPTVVAAAGASVPKDLDGRNLLPHWRGDKKKPPHDVLVWGRRNGSRFALRCGDWKLVRDNEDRKAKPRLGLFNLAKDPEEKHNLLEKEKKIAAELQALYKDWRKHTVR